MDFICFAFKSIRLRYQLVLLVAFLIFNNTLRAQIETRDSLRVHNSRIFQIKQIVPSVLALTMSAFMVDETMYNFVDDNRSYFMDDFSSISDVFGEKTIVVPAVILSYGVSRFLINNDKLEATSFKAMQSILVTALATEGLKYIFGRSRPFNELGAYTFNSFPGNNDSYKSLPSGHSSLAFALFTPLAEIYSRWLYIIPVSVAAGRVYQNKHWTSDVILGGGIGFLSGFLFTHNPNVEIIPGGLKVFF